jgi:GNAT superfamily N-acetyltransferase
MDPSIRVATLDELPAVTAVMATAFSRDPAWGPYSFPDDHRRVEQLAAFWRPQLRAAMRFPWTFVTPGCEAAAVWIPPGEPELTAEQEREVADLTAEMVGQEQADVIFEVFAQLEREHPHDPPHFYLSLLGTHDDHRGRGLGMALLGDSLRLIDGLGMPAYLESTNPANNERYMRHGFQPVGEVTMANGHRITTMWREAASA